MDVMEAIYRRRSVRAYTDQPVEKVTVEALIKAATNAPSSMNEQPWAFAVIQSPKQLALWSERIKADVLRQLKPGSPLVKYRNMLSSPSYDVFHRAGTLIIICARPDTHNGDRRLFPGGAESDARRLFDGLGHMSHRICAVLVEPTQDQAKSRYPGSLCAGVSPSRRLSERRDAAGATAGAGNPSLGVGRGSHS